MSHGLVMEDTIIKDSQAMETKRINNAKEFIALIISPLPAPLEAVLKKLFWYNDN